MGCTLIQAVLGALLGWANHPPVLAAAVDCLRGVLRTLTSGEALHEDARTSPPSCRSAAYSQAEYVSGLVKEWTEPAHCQDTSRITLTV